MGCREMLSHRQWSSGMLCLLTCAALISSSSAPCACLCAQPCCGGRHAVWQGGMVAVRSYLTRQGKKTPSIPSLAKPIRAPHRVPCIPVPPCTAPCTVTSDHMQIRKLFFFVFFYSIWVNLLSGRRLNICANNCFPPACPRYAALL